MSAIRAFATRRAPFAFVQRAAFSQSIVRPAGKESALHSEGRAHEVEEKKQEQLNKQKQGQANWEEQLASDSESAVKADRSETGKDTQQQIKELQDESKKVKPGQ
ncbi:mitochondrial carrier protein pet8 protein [Stemphylium lycopersici]|uniref:Mitochondrial carrier protein pet8 protein n=1 Tax=Stemphylium lycopersici TaxID=183478 RepID=A0A364MSA1_STELY|nr:mitochondrial carrier protein pet8 protein [Stemphylium lycopersici]RAQ99626.1 mitochondrial carrier protein pet8 protein [Stemphylium lycopersici]RAR01832.1 mitochondrial carrier protein pet8 protein [Stemphylium lycopersici]